MQTRRYDMDRALEPIWRGESVYLESVMLVGGRNRVDLAYPARRVLEVRSSDLNTLYEEGTDYALEDGSLVIPEGSRLPRFAHDEYYLSAPVPNGSFECALGGHILFGEGGLFHARQFLVSYEHDPSPLFPQPQAQLNLLDKTRALLEGGNTLRVLFYGDSITTGCNCSDFMNLEPFLPSWMEMTMDGLARRYPRAHLFAHNTAVGGTATEWGLENARERAARLKPDLCFLAFGMNDGTAKIAPQRYISQTQGIMAQVRAANPECEFVLVATMLPNREVKGFDGLQRDYLPDLLNLKGPGCALADMTSLHGALLGRKRYEDMTGNNVNHPNDFLSRVYAQLMLRTLEAEPNR